MCPRPRAMAGPGRRLRGAGGRGRGWEQPLGVPVAAQGKGEPASAPAGVSHGVHEKMERKREVSGNGGVRKHHPSHGRIEVFWALHCRHLL